MANLVWTAILYFFTLSIVFVAYKTFINDRKYENELRVANQVRAAQGISRGTMRPAATADAASVAAPSDAAPARRFTAPPRSARNNTIPANIRRA